MTTVQYQQIGHAVSNPGQQSMQSSSATDMFPYKRHRTAGVLQIILGLSAIILQLINIQVVRNQNEKPINDFQDQDEIFHLTWIPSFKRDLSSSVTYAGTGIWTGLVFILVGSFGAAMTPARKNTRQCLKITVLVLAVINAGTFAPTLVIAEIIEISWANNEWHPEIVNYEARLICPYLLLVIGIAEFVATIVAASFCGCGNSSDIETYLQTSRIHVTSYTTYPGGKVPGQAVIGSPYQTQVVQVIPIQGLLPSYEQLPAAQFTKTACLLPSQVPACNQQADMKQNESRGLEKY